MSELPHDEMVEGWVLAEMMLSPQALNEVADGPLRIEDFHFPAHADLFQAILELHERGLPADPRSVAVALVHADLIDHVGGAKYMAGLLDSLPESVHGHAAAWAEFLVGLGEQPTEIVR